jgi:hypothetical protein
MEILKCEYPQCDTTLTILDEIVTGLCGRHHKKLSDNNHYCVICWHCGCIIKIEPSVTRKGAPIVNEKYIFATACPSCDKKADGYKWMNNPKKDDLSKVVLGKDDTVHPAEFGLMAGRKRSFNHKVLGEADIIQKVQLRKEANERLSSFLDNLNMDGDNHDNRTLPS